MEAIKENCTASAYKQLRTCEYSSGPNHYIDQETRKYVCRYPDKCNVASTLYKDGTDEQFHVAVEKTFMLLLHKAHGFFHETPEGTNIRLGEGKAHIVQKGDHTMGPADMAMHTFTRLRKQYAPEVTKHVQQTCLCHYCMIDKNRFTALSKNFE